MFRDILHKIKIFFCDEDIEKIYVRDSTVIRNNEIHKMYDDDAAIRTQSSRVAGCVEASKME